MSRSSSGFVVALALALSAFTSGCLVNRPPEVTAGPRPNPLSIGPGGEVALELEVADPDGDELEYSWSQVPAEPAGRFSDRHARNPTWTAPDIGETTTFNLTVTITDGEGAGLRGTAPPVVVRVN